MDDFRIPQQVCYNPLKEDFSWSFGYDLDDTMNRSSFEANSIYNSGSGMTNVFTSLEVVSTKELNPQTSKLGDWTFAVPDDDFFENFDQFLINDNQFEKENNADSSGAQKRDLDTVSSPTNTAFSKPKTKYTSRVDVVNKGILRMVKSFFQDLLFKHFPTYKTKRLCRVNKARLLGDVSSLVKLFKNKSHDAKKLGEYMFCALRPSDVAYVSQDPKLHKEVKLYFNCISKYSHKRLQEVFRTSFGRIIFELIVKNEGLLDRLFESNSLVKKNRAAYDEGLERFMKGFNLE